jgi:hypothetical protein
LCIEKGEAVFVNISLKGLYFLLFFESHFLKRFASLLDKKLQYSPKKETCCEKIAGPRVVIDSSFPAFIMG